MAQDLTKICFSTSLKVLNDNNEAIRKSQTLSDQGTESHSSIAGAAAG